MENLAEALTLANKTGVGADLLMEFVKEFLPSPSFVGYGGKMLENCFEGDQVGFTVEGALRGTGRRWRELIRCSNRRLEGCEPRKLSIRSELLQAALPSSRLRLAAPCCSVPHHRSPTPASFPQLPRHPQASPIHN